MGEYSHAGATRNDEESKMLKSTIRIVLIATLVCLSITAVGLMISYRVDGSTGLIFFILGAIPVGLFLPGLFSHATSGTLHTPRLVFRLIDSLSRKLGHHPDPIPNEFTVSLALVLAGLMVWLIGAMV